MKIIKAVVIYLWNLLKIELERVSSWLVEKTTIVVNRQQWIKNVYGFIGFVVVLAGTIYCIGFIVKIKIIEPAEAYIQNKYEKRITIISFRTDDSKIEDRESDLIENDQPIESREVSTCNEAAEKWSKVYQVNQSLLKKIIKAESSNNEVAANPISSARGCSQWIIGSWESYGKKLWGDDFYNKNVYDPNDNVELMAWTISEYGTSPWDYSKDVWSK